MLILALYPNLLNVSFLYKYNFDSNTKITKEKAYMIERNKNRGDDDGF